MKTLNVKFLTFDSNGLTKVEFRDYKTQKNVMYVIRHLAISMYY